jgi:fructose-bisphosphate aldolase class 1
MNPTPELRSVDAMGREEMKMDRKELIALLKESYGAVNDAFGQANAEYQGLDHLASKYDEKIQAFRAKVRAALKALES